MRNSPVVIVRPIDSKDCLATITELLHSAYARLGAMGFNYTAVDQTEETTRRRIAGGTCLVAVDGYEPVGTIMFYEPGRSKGVRGMSNLESRLLANLESAPSDRDVGLVPAFFAKPKCWESPAERLSSHSTRPRALIT
jgi:hypothetical protein